MSQNHQKGSMLHDLLLLVSSIHEYQLLKRLSAKIALHSKERAILEPTGNSFDKTPQMVNITEVGRLFLQYPKCIAIKC